MKEREILCTFLLLISENPGLGHTVAALGDVSHCARFEKTRFSMCIPAVVEHMNTLKVPSGIHFWFL